MMFTLGNCVKFSKRNWIIMKRREIVVLHSPSEFSYHLRGIVNYVLMPTGPPKVRGLFGKKID